MTIALIFAHTHREWRVVGEKEAHTYTEWRVAREKEGEEENEGEEHGRRRERCIEEG
jgi:hypothetical protein